MYGSKLIPIALIPPCGACKPTDSDWETVCSVIEREMPGAGKLGPEQTPVISFRPTVVAAVKRARPDLPAYWVVSLDPKDKTPPTAGRLVARAEEMRADGLDLSASDLLGEAFARGVKTAGLKLYVWTVNDPGVARRMIELGADGITTDRPGWLREQPTK